MNQTHPSPGVGSFKVRKPEAEAQKWGNLQGHPQGVCLAQGGVFILVSVWLPCPHQVHLFYGHKRQTFLVLVLFILKVKCKVIMTLELSG